jgi:hypothetical protein
LIYIWIRRTVDWADEEAAVAQLTDPWLLPKIPLWNKTFDMTYQRFRLRLTEIADLNHSRVAGAVRASWDEIPEDAIVLPIDDDDWFAPDAARTLAREAESAKTFYHWPARWLEVPIDLGHRMHLLRRRILPRTPPKWLCATNNYAMLKGPRSREILGNHLVASRWLEQRLDDPAVKRLAEPLGLANRTLASQTTLSQRRLELRRSELLRKLRRHRRLYERALRTDLGWARPYVEMMAALMGELRPRPRGA